MGNVVFLIATSRPEVCATRNARRSETVATVWMSYPVEHVEASTRPEMRTENIEMGERICS